MAARASGSLSVRLVKLPSCPGSLFFANERRLYGEEEERERRRRAN